MFQDASYVNYNPHYKSAYFVCQKTASVENACCIYPYALKLNTKDAITMNPDQLFSKIHLAVRSRSISFAIYSKTCLKRPLIKKTKIVFKTDSRLTQHSAILSTFIKPLFVIKIFDLSIFEWPLKTGFTVIHQRA